MPIYEYVCSVCRHRADILHGVNEAGPHFCPECGAEGSMRKAIVPPTIVFKGSGWAKRDRRSAASKSSKGGADGDRGKASSGAGDESGPKGGQASSGDRGSASSGDRGSASSGDRGSASSGDRGSASSGDRGSASSGDRGSASSGDGD
jgi:putative FmdB family regulatory protein